MQWISCFSHSVVHSLHSDLPARPSLKGQVTKPTTHNHWGCNFPLMTRQQPCNRSTVQNSSSSAYSILKKHLCSSVGFVTVMYINQGQLHLCSYTNSDFPNGLHQWYYTRLIVLPERTLCFLQLDTLYVPRLTLGDMQALEKLQLSEWYSSFSQDAGKRYHLLKEYHYTFSGAVQDSPNLVHYHVQCLSLELLQFPEPLQAYVTQQ